MNNPEKNRMRKKVISLFNYWKNVTRPTKYNVVSLPGESFEFEAHALDKVKSDENMLLFMYEKSREIFDSFKDSVEETMSGFYINQSLHLLRRLLVCRLSHGMTSAEILPLKGWKLLVTIWEASRFLSLPSPISFAVQQV